MPIAFYMDHHVPRAITLGLRVRKVEVLTAYEDGTSELDDAALLDRASESGRVLFTRDDDLLSEATKRTKRGYLLPRDDLRPPTPGFDWAVRTRFEDYWQGWRSGRLD